MSQPFESDAEAIEILIKNHVDYHGGIIRLPRGTLDPVLLNSVDYLCEEWDYDMKWIDAISESERNGANRT
jgi:hypothetical protein